MKATIASIAGILMLFTGFLFGTQQSGSRDQSSKAFFALESQPQPQPEPERPPGVGAASWVPLGPTCGVVVRDAANGRDDFLMGQLSCKVRGQWHSVFLSERPPTVTPSE